MSISPKDPTLPVDDAARRLAKDLLRTARAGALATNDHATGAPFASLVALASDIDGVPVILTSQLSTHTQALDADPLCSLLVSSQGKGDPLAHPRLTIVAKARRIVPQTEEAARIRRRYLAHHPKAELYVDFTDFGFWRLEISSASLNGGFGRAYRMTAADVLTEPSDDLTAMEADVIDHMNSDHADAVALYATALCGAEPGPWRMVSLDREGAQLAAGDRMVRLTFPHAISSADALRPMLIDLAKRARQV